MRMFTLLILICTLASCGGSRLAELNLQLDTLKQKHVFFSREKANEGSILAQFKKDRPSAANEILIQQIKFDSATLILERLNGEIVEISTLISAIESKD